jgi:hypothetical protein
MEPSPGRSTAKSTSCTLIRSIGTRSSCASGEAVQQLKREPGRTARGSVKLPLALAQLGLIDDRVSWCSLG